MIIASRHPHWTDTYPKSQTQNKKAHIGIAEKSGKPVWASFHNSKIIFNRFLSWAVRQNDKPYHPHSLYLLTYPHPKIDPIYTRTALYVGLLSLTLSLRALYFQGSAEWFAAQNENRSAKTESTVPNTRGRRNFVGAAENLLIHKYIPNML